MQKKTAFFLFLTLVFLGNYFGRPAAAQDTFGPTCEVGVTCTPTPPPPRPTTPPPPTATPKLPVTGNFETTLSFLGVGGLLLIFGIGGAISFRLARQ